MDNENKNFSIKLLIINNLTYILFNINNRNEFFRIFFIDIFVYLLFISFYHIIGDISLYILSYLLTNFINSNLIKKIKYAIDIYCIFVLLNENGFERIYGK